MTHDSAATLGLRLGYRFQDPELLYCALTHRSAGRVNNERLEFLGDAMLGLVIAHELYRMYPEASEGDLSRLRASLVQGRTLAEVAAELELGKHLRLGEGEMKSGGHRRASILAGALEGVFGAILIDGGVSAANECIRRLFRARLDSAPDVDSLKDSKTRLQEVLQARGAPLPHYEIINVSGQAHAQTFVVECRVDNAAATRGEGRSRRRAEQAAAERMLVDLGARTKSA